MTSDTARMNTAQEKAWQSLVAVSHRLPAVLDEQLLEEAGLIHFEYAVLKALELTPDQTVRMRALARSTGSTAPRLSKAISRLERRGLVERVSCAQDGRGVNIRLTAAGEDTLRAATPPYIELACDTIFAGLSEDELADLARMLDHIDARLSPAGAGES